MIPNRPNPSTTSQPMAGSSGSYSNSAITSINAPSHGNSSEEDKILQARIARARLSGPSQITADASVADMDADGNIVILFEGTNEWTCFPGDENKIGDVPMCCDPMGMVWMKDAMARKPKPTNTAPGLIYMLCGATQHSNTDASDKTSAPIPIGPHWMILWPYDAARDGLPRTVRDAGAWVMFDGTPYAYLHICGTPWVGNEYSPELVPVWTMQYSKAQQ